MEMNKKNKIIIFSFSAMLLISLLLVIYKSELTDNQSGIPGFDRPEGFLEYFNQITIPIGARESGYTPNYQYHEYQKLRKFTNTFKSANASLIWVQRGPGNVGGRTRTVIIDPDDTTNNTWYAAAVSGGVWKTIDAGGSWINLTDDLPNLSTVAMAMAPSNTNILYVGTGEGFGAEGMVVGNGIYKSEDKGQSWELLQSTDGNDNFRYVNELVIHPENELIVLAATNDGIYKSVDGGVTWTGVYTAGYAVQDLDMNPQNHNVIFAGANSLGILKTTDFGDSWQISSDGIGTGYRFSVTVSPVDTSYIYTCVEAPRVRMDIYMSKDGGKTWLKYKDADGTYTNFHQSQGWFNNVIKAHPFDKNKFFVGGVYLGMMEVLRSTGISEPQVIRADTVGTGEFMAFVNFGGTHLGGSLITGLDEDAEVEESDFVNVEIRFGPDIQQKAHRFTVPEGEGSGVPPEDYTYQDYISVPFQAWDMDNNKQLMVSFRDQENDGEFNLIEREYGDEISGREYIFVHHQAYSENEPHSDIAQQGGHYNGMLYFLWPALAEDKEWKPDSLPGSNINIIYGTFVEQEMTTKVLADDRLNEELHVDHHDLQIRITNAANEQFMILNANDGGLGLSEDGGVTWKQISNGYLTTQFYGMAKRTGAHEYIGGMQDNGTWQSPAGQTAGESSEYKFQIEGDGFEVLWHPWYPQRIIGSSYNNYFKITNDFGQNWEWTTSGINGDGPFLSKLSHSRENPNLVFAVGSRGLYKHNNFGLGRYDWERVDLGDYWTVNNIVLSSHNVKVSKSNPAIVWAGAGMFFDPDIKIFCSSDYGQSFDTVTTYTDREMGFISGMATHPSEDSTAYIMFSYRYRPKILRTTDMGNSWEDISGFDQDSSSANGFPDVRVYSLCVMPDEPQTIWVGTEIGIIESNDNGETWHLASTGLPAVSVWQIDIQDENIMVATHGRGLWSARLDGTVNIKENKITDPELSIYPNPASDHINLQVKNAVTEQIDLYIYSLEGKLVLNRQFFGMGPNDKKNIDLSDLSSGTYYLRLVSGDFKEITKLIVL